jgi:hypothetical protein
MEPINYLPPLRTAIALTGTLVVAFVLCALVQAILPSAQFSHMWLQLFTAAPLGSFQAWIEGVIASAVVGFITGYCFGHCYNWSGKHFKLN